MRTLLQRKALTGGDGLHHAERAVRDHLSAPGQDRDYQLTEIGRQLFADLGIVIHPGRRREVAYCVDWTEQRHHLAGAAGAALLTRLDELGWIQHGAKKTARALTITDAGRNGFHSVFGIDTAEFDTRSARC